MGSEPDDYVARHSTVGSGAAGRATDGETDETLESEWVSPGETPPESATTPPDMTQMPDPDGSRHAI
jgi:hypothetical protein